nr:G-type lectin S-receptor-like serine/threonine-protein kinase At4g27290 [Ipomoea batatas]
MGWACCISYFFLAFLCFFCNLGLSADSLRPGESVTPNRTLVSAGGNFALGFFRPGNSSSSFLGIWYNTNNTVIWVANRESPLPQDSEPVFTLGYDGNLQLLDGGGRNIIWSTNISGGGSTAAQLQDTGDLVVKQGESIVWESFDGDSDTLMPGMRLKVNKKTGKRNLLRSWIGSDDPRPGKFSWAMDPKGSSQFFIWKEGKPYYRSITLQLGFTYSAYFPSGGYAYYSYATENDEVYFSYGYANTLIQARFTLTPEGRIQFLLRQKESDEWPKLWEVPATDCELYARCGSFGSCERFDSHSVCSCLEGFKPKSQKDWDKGKYDAGCERIIALGCGEADTFMRLPMMKWPDHSSSLGNMTFQECEMECSKDCSCTAFGYANITSNSAVNCINWFGDFDLGHNYSSGGFGQDLYVRVHSSELNGSSGNDHSPHKNKRRLVAIIVASVSAFFLICVLVYILTCGRKGWVCKRASVSTATLLGKEDIELLHLSLRRIIDATNKFHETNKLGEGGFGPVYKGFLSEFGMVAIKRLSKQSSQGLNEFMNELKLIAKLQHTNFVRILGCCIEDEEKILIYEYMPKRSLDTFLFDGSSGNDHSPHKNKRRLVAIIVASVSAFFLICVLVYILTCGRKGWVCKRASVSTATLLGKEDIELLHLSLRRIIDATNKFHETNKLGEGGFGPVYKGFLSEFGMVAIKRLSKQSSQGLNEFMNELKLIAKLQHTNLCEVCEMAIGAVSNGGKRRRGAHTHMGCLCYVLLAFLCFFCNLGLSADSLRPGESVTPNQTLVSAGGDFALGFFRPGNSSSSFLGIWYNTINNTVIWVANRESPLPHDSEAVFTLGYDGNLQLLDGGRNVIWSTNISGSGLAGNSTAAQLQDTGDLVVKQGESTVWESFDGDSDTLMPGMKLKVNTKTRKRNVIRCWSSSDDPRPGKFLWGVDVVPKGSPQYLIWKEDKPYYRSTTLQQGFTYSSYFPSGGYAYYSYATENDEVYFTYGYTKTSIQARFLLTPEGRLQFLLRQNASDEWPKLWEAPTTDCELYARCGSFGSCEIFNSPSVCRCLEGFKPRSQRDWDKGKYDAGCERSIALGCGEADTFMRLPMMKWPDHSSSLGNMTFQDCEMECSKTCSCTAFAYANASNSAVNCINWFGDLVDLAHNYSTGGYGQDLYVRVHSYELNGSSGNDDSSHKNKHRVVAIIVASVSAFFLITVLVYILTWKYCERKGWVCKKSTVSADAPVLGKDNIELLHLSFRRIIEATNNFDEANRLGEGGFGPVYKGFVSEFGMVAIKRLSKQSSQGLKEFMNELKLIAKLQHTNLVCEMAMGAVSNGGKRRRGGDIDMGWLCYVFLAFLCFFCNLGASTDSLRPGEAVTPNQTLVSDGGNFALGFFRPGNSSSSFLGIWYTTNNNTVIWVANRESPLPQHSEAFFTLGYDGNLQLLDGGGRNIIWSTNISGSGLAGNSTAAQLQDTGDLIVKQGESIVWGSFDGDSDTLMPGMRLKVNKKTGKRNLIRSWISSDDPRPGKFSWGMDPKGSPQMFIWKENITHFRTTLYQDGFPYSVYFPSAGYTSYSFATENDEVYFSYGYANTSIQARFLLTPEGYIHILSRPKTSEIWHIQWVAPRLDCELYARCGSFGTCERIDSHPVCSCLEGFKPKSQRDWDKGKYDAGCERSIALECGEADTFMRLPMMKWPDHSSSLGNMTFKECEMECSKTCSCTAFAYATTSNSAVNCINWFGDLVDLARNYSPGGFSQDLYVRVHSSELIASVSAFFLITVLVYILAYGRKGWVCRKATVSTASLLGKDDIELLQLSLRRIIDATNNFHEANKLGEGGFGPVYKGFLSEFGMVAIKRLSKQSSQGLNEFMNELKLIAKLQHTNLVRLLGCCVEDEEKILIYEYLPKRSLDKFLFGTFVVFYVT